ncbi:linear amide C-N hydrolase [Vibrio aestuarianus]|uniref:linear amide C-N hydrolase n=1 Tax=Vibrio aestuarianus TaxID=28171 RepID=UPI0015584072|nr:linear amide C-N hydrolase [Vibrio aestuarianus]NGZ15283.1 linear amide C-N hydrolase [Vibrio aestuarianus]NKZ51431.1 linear amide C-N hydrolase [Vibrio aestuarianus]
MNKQLNKAFLTTCIISSISIPTITQACSNVFWDSPQGVIVTRTMDWMESTKPLLLKVTAGEKRNFHGTGTSEQEYTVKNSFLAIGGYGKLIGEGVNEHGLHSSIQYYGDMQMEKGNENTLSQNELAGYFLANFNNVQQVIDSVKDIEVGLTAIPGMEKPPRWHYIVSDVSGDRAVIQYDDNGVNIYRGDDAQVVTNSNQKVLNEAWIEKSKQLKEFGGYGSQFQLGAGNTDSEQRYVFAKYFLSQIKNTSSPKHAMMSVEGTAFKVPQQATYRPQDGMDTYATEYTITYNLNSGDMVFKYTGDDWYQREWNYKELLASDQKLETPLYGKES